MSDAKLPPIQVISYLLPAEAAAINKRMNINEDGNDNGNSNTNNPVSEVIHTYFEIAGIHYVTERYSAFPPTLPTSSAPVAQFHSTTANTAAQANTPISRANDGNNNAPSDVNQVPSLTPSSNENSQTGDTAATPDSLSSSSLVSALTPSDLLNPPQTIVYSPFNSDRSCKDYNTIKADLQMLLSKKIKKIRLYGVDCLTVSAIFPISKELGITINQGFWITNAGVNSMDSDLSNVIQWAQSNGWRIFDFFTIGNEVILNRSATVRDLISKISEVKSELRRAGYGGQVTTAEPPVIYFTHPELCTQSEIDFVGINSHSYFNSKLYAYQAGEHVTTEQRQVAQICSKMTVITETGYPHNGQVNGNNVPTPENQKIALKSILDATGGDVTILTTFDDYWKDQGPYGIEQSFGMINLVS